MPDPDSKASSTNWTWTRLLRAAFLLIGAALMSALIPMCFPTSWMSSIHQWLGLGEFPQAKITMYLARSTSLLYAVHGCVMFFVGWNFDRCRLLVPLFGWLNLVIGVALIGIDLDTQMPLYWSLAEGPSIIAGGIAILWMDRRAHAETSAAAMNP